MLQVSFRKSHFTPVGISHVHSPLSCCQPTTDGLADDGTQGLFKLLSVTDRKFPWNCKSCRIVCDWSVMEWSGINSRDHAWLPRVTFNKWRSLTVAADWWNQELTGAETEILKLKTKTDRRVRVRAGKSFQTNSFFNFNPLFVFQHHLSIFLFVLFVNFTLD